MVDIAAIGSILTLSGFGVSPYSARGLTQTLEPIEAAAHLRRTINGTLLDLSLSQFRRYRSTISGSDQAPPAFGSMWPGMQVTVGCVARLAYLTATGTPERPVVPGSSVVEGNYTYYRPNLIMRVLGWNLDEDEWAAGISWSLSLEEV